MPTALMTTPIGLKYKYTRGRRLGTYEFAPKQNKHSDNNGPKSRKKLQGKQLAAAREVTLINKKYRHVMANGKSRFERV